VKEIIHAFSSEQTGILTLQKHQTYINLAVYELTASLHMVLEYI